MSEVNYRSLDAGRPPVPGNDVFDGSIASPMALVRAAELDANIVAMQRWCDERRVVLAPHGKTTLSPALFQRQLDAGAWGITAASPAQARIAVNSGVNRIILANEVADLAGIRWLGRLRRESPELVIACYVDSMESVALLDQVLTGELPEHSRLDVLVELGTAGGRTGLRDDDRALEVAAAVARTRSLRVAGVAGYEGIVGGQADDTGIERVLAFCDRLGETAAALAAGGYVEASDERPMIVTAGGSVFFDEVARSLASRDYAVPTLVVLRSGCYVVHDHGMYARLTPAARGLDGPVLSPALEVWGRVLSRPEPGRAVVDIGRRDISFDADLPVVLAVKPVRGGPARAVTASVVSLNDQHAFLDLPSEADLKVGEWVGMGVSHPCTTFDKWSELLLVDEEHRLLSPLGTAF